MKIIEGSITSPLGFQAAGVACGLKKNSQPDLALLVSDVRLQLPAFLPRIWSKAIPCS